MIARQIILFSLTVIFSLSLKAQDLTTIPLQDLDGNVAPLSKSSGDHYLLALALHPDAEEELAAWWMPIYQSFIDRKTGGLLMVDEIKPVKTYLVPVVTTGGKKAAAAFVKKAKAEADTGIYELIRVWTKPDGDLLKSLGITDKKIAYFLLVSPDGNLLVMEKGAFDQDKLERLETPLLVR